MLQVYHKLSKKFMLPPLQLLQIHLIIHKPLLNVLVLYKIKSFVVHAGHSQLLLHSHKVDVFKVLIRNSFNIHKNILSIVIKVTMVVTVVTYS